MKRLFVIALATMLAVTPAAAKTKPKVCKADITGISLLVVSYGAAMVFAYLVGKRVAKKQTKKCK